MSNKKGKTIRKYIFFGLVFLPLGYVLGIATHIFLPFIITIDEKIEIEDVISIFCTIVLGWYISTILDKEKQTDLNIKNILSRRLEEIYDLTIQFNDKSTTDNFCLTDATASIKRINRKLTGIINQIKNSELTIDDKFKDAVISEVSKLDNLMTNSPVGDNNPNPAVKVVNNKLTFNEQRAFEIASSFEELREKLTDFELAIMNAD